MDSTSESSADDLRNNPYTGAGFMLRSAREEQGLSLSEIAARTRISLRQLELIEAGAMDALPSRTYAIGFARTYARAIGLDEAPITGAVRAELGDNPEPGTAATSSMEPGDPAKLPSKGLAWTGAIAALLLAAGLFAWFGTYFGAGEGAPALVVEPAEQALAEEPEPDAADLAPADGAAVTFTALEDRVWVRLYQEGGARLLEKTLTKGESFTVPATASDPRLNTGRPDALAITIDGKPAARLAERAVNLGGEPVSAAALLARATTAAPASVRAPVPDTSPATGLAAGPARGAASGSAADAGPTAPATTRRERARPAPATPLEPVMPVTSLEPALIAPAAPAAPVTSARGESED